MKRKKKGEAGYRSDHRKVQAVLVAVLLAAVFAQLGARYFVSSKSFRTLLTVMAVLTVLPMANLASPLLAAWKYKSAAPAFIESCRAYEGKFPILYDLIITSKEQILPADAAVVHPTGVYLCCPAAKIDVKKAESFLNGMLTDWKLDPNARVITEEKTFFKRLASLKEVTEEEDDGSADVTVRLLKNLSM